VQGAQGFPQVVAVQGDEPGDGADVGLPARGDGFDEEAGEFVLLAGDGDQVAWGEVEEAAEFGGLLPVARPPAGLFHVAVGVELEAGGAGDVLGGDAAGQAVFEQGAGSAHEIGGGAPQSAGQGDEFAGGGQGDAAFPGDDVVRGDVRHAVGGAHVVSDAVGAHPELLAQGAGGARVEGDRWLHGQRLRSS
jgi:hypothetical protein